MSAISKIIHSNLITESRAASLSIIQKKSKMKVYVGLIFAIVAALSITVIQAFTIGGPKVIYKYVKPHESMSETVCLRRNNTCRNTTVTGFHKLQERYRDIHKIANFHCTDLGIGLSESARCSS